MAIKAIKRAYLRPPLRLYSPNGKILSVLSGNSIKNAYDIVKTSTRNDVDKLSFKVAYRNVKQLLNYNSCELLLKFGNNEVYIIKNVKLSDENKRVIEVMAENFFTVLKGIKCQSLNLIGQSPEELFNAIIASPKNVNLVGKYKFKGTDIVNTFRAVQTEDEASVFENLLTLCEKFNAFMEFSFDESGQKWIYIRKTPINKGKFIKKGKGLKSLDIEVDSSEIFTRMYGYGCADSITGNEITFMSVNPTGKAYVENTDYFKALGMTDEEISNNEQVLQECDYRDNTITTPTELFRITQEELSKVCVPKISGTVSMSDFSVYEGSSLTEPNTSEEIIFIDGDINFNIKCWIESIERRYSENPMDISVTISNTIKYDSTLKDLVRSSDATTSVTAMDSSGNTYVPASTVYLDDGGSHINIPYKTGQMQTQITENAEEIRLTAEDLEVAKGELVVQARKISAVVEEGTEVGSWELSKDAMVIAFNGSTNRKATIDRTQGLLLGDVDTGTYSLIGYDGKLTLYMGGNTRPYHCLSYTNYIEFSCNSDNDDYTPVTDSLPSMFDGIPNEQISVSVSIQKFYKSGYYLPYWIGGYGTVIGETSKIVKLYGMSAWREIIYDSDSNGYDWVKDFSSPVDGSLILRYTVIA